MKTYNEAALQEMLETSEFLALLNLLKNNADASRLFGNAVRSLTDNEIADLKVQGNQCANWNLVTVRNGHFSTQYITGNTITGPCVLGNFEDVSDQVSENILPPGVHNSILANTEIGDNCKIYSCAISNYVVNSGAILHNIGSLSCSAISSFGNGIIIPVGIETGGRDVRSFAELPFDLAVYIAQHRSNTDFLFSYDHFVDEYVAECRIGFGYIDSDCVCMNTPVIADTCIVGAVTIQGATALKNTTLIGTHAAPTLVHSGALVENSCINIGSHVSGHAVVNGSVFTQHVQALRHANVIHSIIAHNTEIAEGEVTASLVGPFVGFHHQALLIGALWPEGKGNVGYGANVGSNHTSKVPDQEIFCGEGMFFGLGTNIKFPANYAESPYSIIATGVTTLPQRIRFPFSLICTPTFCPKDIPGAFNELLPGWVLSDNMYMVKRNEEKFKHRSRVRIKLATYDVFRPDSINLMISARNVLHSVTTIKNIYCDKDIEGIGKNFMTEQSRQNGINAYMTYIEYYALKGLKLHIEQMIAANIPVTTETAYTAGVPDNHPLEILQLEGYDNRTVTENLLRLVELEEYCAQTTHSSREKDELRGRKIIPDYDATHTIAAQDPFVLATWKAMYTLRDEVEMMIKKIVL
jgi:hypothetical protein